MIPFPTTGELFEHILKLFIPYTVISILFILNYVSLSHIGFDLRDAPLFLAAVYYWSLYRPTLIPYGLIFVLGLCIDVIVGFPLGLNALILGLVRYFVANQRRFLMAQSFFAIWLGFTLTWAGVLLLTWFSMSLMNFRLLEIGYLPFAVLNGFLIYPFLAITLNLSHKILTVSGTQTSLRIKV